MSSSQPSLPRAVGVLLGLTVLVDAAFLLGLSAPDWRDSAAVNVGVSLASQWVPVAVFWLVAVATRFRRLPVVLATAGVTLSALGDTYYTLGMDADGYLPSPSPADVGYVLFYPLLLAALLALVPRGPRRVGGILLIETAVATLGSAAVLALVLGPVIGAAFSGGHPAANLIAAAYPLFDLVILAAIVGVASLGAGMDRRWWALGLGLGVFAAADIAFALLDAQGAYAAGTPLDAAWAVGLALITWWGAGMARPSLEPRRARWGSAVVPALSVVAGLAVLVIGTAMPIPLPAVALAAATVGLAAVPIVFRQVMLRRTVEAQEEAVRRLTELDQAKSDLLATVNHEFRTPLTSINGHVELLVDGELGDLPPAALDTLRTVQRSGERLQRLIDEAFSASRSTDEPGGIRVDLGNVVREIADAFAPIAAARGIEFVVDLGDEDVAVIADPARLDEAVRHLVENAVKFTPDDGRVTVSLRVDDEGLVLTVRDTGIGIPDYEMSALFSRFFRASTARRAAIPGVGLGLATARRILRSYGGDVELASTVGVGTVATARLPRA